MAITPGPNYDNAASADPFVWGLPKRDPNPTQQKIADAIYARKNPAPAAEGDWFDKFMAEQQAQYDKAYARNEARDKEIRGIYGQSLDSAAAGVTANAAPQPLNERMNNWGASGPIYSPDAARINQNAMDRGIYNSQPALNYANVSNDLSTAQAQNSIYDRQYQAQQNAQNRQDQLRTGLGGFIERQTDAYPDQNLLAQMAMQYGQGNLDYLGGGGGAPLSADGGAFGGSGYGGAVQSGYYLPVNNGFYTDPRQPANRRYARTVEPNMVTVQQPAATTGPSSYMSTVFDQKTGTWVPRQK